MDNKYLDTFLKHFLSKEKPHHSYYWSSLKQAMKLHKHAYANKIVKDSKKRKYTSYVLSIHNAGHKASEYI